MNNKFQQFRRKMKGYMLKKMHGMITCREFEAFIIDYLEDSLLNTERMKFEIHLKLCRECREYLQAYSLTKNLCLELRVDPNAIVPETVPADLIKAVIDSKNQLS